MTLHVAVIIPKGTKLDLSIFKRYVDIWGHLNHVLTTNWSIDGGVVFMILSIKILLLFLDAQ